MRFAYCLFKYFPFGGLQRDFLRIAEETLSREHEVCVYTMEWQGDIPAGLEIKIVPTFGLTNHSRARHFAKNLQKIFAEEAFDAIIGFNKMPHLHGYYAADSCFIAKAHDEHGKWFRLTNRYRQYKAFEKIVFSAEEKTKIFLLSEKERSYYEKFYKTPAERFYLLPPGISKDRIAPNNAEEIKQRVRAEYAIAEDEFLLLLIGSSFRIKGVDRAILALRSLPLEIREKTYLFIIGQDNEKPYLRMVNDLHLVDQVVFLGGRDDVGKFLLGADCLLHPAYRENTGTVLLEALVAGLPVLASDVCGYASHITTANAGMLIPSPFKQKNFNKLLLQILSSNQLKEWGKNGLDYATRTDLFSLPQKAVDYIEEIGTSL